MLHVMKFRHFAISLCSAVCFFIPIEKVISMHVGGLVGENTIHLSSYTSLHALAARKKIFKNLRMLHAQKTWIAEVCSLVLT